MTSIVAVNITIPCVKDYYSYGSGQSLHDFDIILFNPEFPYFSYETFSDGSTAIERSSGESALKSIDHWKNEITNALKAGKTVFFLLAEQTNKSYITGLSSSTSKTRMYNTGVLSNYSALPIKINLRNSKGTKIKVTDNRFKELFEVLEGHLIYETYLEDEHKTSIATTITGEKTLATIYKLNGHAGHLVLLPYFDVSRLTELNKGGEKIWTNTALGLGTKLIKIIKELDKMFKIGSTRTPQPLWVDSTIKSKHINDIEKKIKAIIQEIEEKTKEKVRTQEELNSAKLPMALLYETGKTLEIAIEMFLKQLGYKVSSFREGSLEIDHIIVSPGGKRLISEAEGKDNSAINIEKFRQLENNINEDFQRDEVTEPASSILFGNGYRLEAPSNRKVQFTEKCLINAKRLSTVLIQTSDLFPISMYLQDNPDDEVYKNECRKIIESCSGDVAIFPPPPIMS